MQLLTANAQGKFTPRLEVLPHWGVPDGFGRASNFTARRAYEAAQRIGGASGLKLYGPKTGRDDYGDDLSSLCPLGPGFTLETAIEWDFWTALQIPNPTDLGVSPDPFRTGTARIYANANKNGAARFQSNQTLGASRGVWLRLALADWNKEQKWQYVAFTFGAGAPFRFRLEFRSGKSAARTIWLRRLAPTWTQANQDQFDTLSGENESDTQEARDALEATLFAQSDDLTSKLGLQKQNGLDYGEFVIIPEGQNALFISGLRGEVTVPIAPLDSEKAARKDAPKTQMYGAGKLQLATNGGVMIWQVGTPAFRLNPVLRLPGALGGAAEIGGHWDQSKPGTGLDFDLDNTDGGDFYHPKITFHSGGAYPAFLYDVAGWQDAGERGPGDAVYFDSDDHKTHGIAPIGDIGVSCEGEHHRLRLTLSLQCRDKFNVAGGVYQPLFHDRMCNVHAGGGLVLGRGLILRAVGNDWADADNNQSTQQTTRPGSRLELEITDMWQLADEWLIREDPILDGMKLGAAIRRILRLWGTKDSEMAGVDPEAGPPIDQAELGQEPCERPAYEVSAGDYLRSLLVRYAPDWTLTPASGVWSLLTKITATVARFCKKPKANQAVPEFRILAPLDIIRDYSDTENAHALQGGKTAETGAVWAEWNDIASTNRPENPRHIGRWKRAQTVTDEGKRTRATALRAVRGINQKDGKPGRFFAFVCETILGLAPGMPVEVEKSRCEIESLSDVSIQYGKARMSVLCRELEFIQTEVVIDGGEGEGETEGDPQ